MVGVQSCSEVGGHRLNEDAFCVQAHPLRPRLLAVLRGRWAGRTEGRWAGSAARLPNRPRRSPTLPIRAFDRTASVVRHPAGGRRRCRRRRGSRVHHPGRPVRFPGPRRGRVQRGFGRVPFQRGEGHRTDRRAAEESPRRLWSGGGSALRRCGQRALADDGDVRRGVEVRRVGSDRRSGKSSRRRGPDRRVAAAGAPPEEWSLAGRLYGRHLGVPG
jgi:hypothetical protein